MPAAAALVLLNASLTFGNVWPTLKIQWHSALSIELAVCVLLLAVSHRWAERLARRALPAVWVLLVAGHYLDVTAPGLYGRDFNLYWDSQHLGNVAAMLARSVPWWLIALVAVAVVASAVAAYLLARLALGLVASAVQRERPRFAIGALALVAIGVFAAGQVSGRHTTGLTFSDPATGAYFRQARSVLAMVGPGRVAPALAESPNLDVDLRGLDGADVMLAFVESYGAVTYDNPAFADALGPSRANFETAVHDAGREVVSAYVESPTFGASSWLAHLSLLTGIKVTDQYSYTSLMTSSRDTIVRAFSRNGYRTVALMPGMRQPWPEGAFYGFDAIYGRDLLAYQGPEFGWWSIPDQYALAKLDALERSKRPRPPVFVVFPTSTSHAPFGPVAPYLPDWSRTLMLDAYNGADLARAAAPDLTNLAPSYARAIAYEYDVFAGYAREHADDNLVMILIGDHQPPAAVSGENQPRDVPVHVITSRRHVLDQLRAHGFRDGVTPARPAAGELHALVPTLLTAFTAQDGEAPATSSPQ
ncbi:MAG: sulfatase-like hydrolase/transferase [Vicinamibacterales bacterium]